MNEYRHLRAERRGDILRVTIDRPEQRNPLSTEVLAELRARLRNRRARQRCASPAPATPSEGVRQAAFDRGRRTALVECERSAARRARVSAAGRRGAERSRTRWWSRARGRLRLPRRCSACCDRFLQERLNICTGFGDGADLVALVGGTGALSILIGAETLPVVRTLQVGLVDEIAAEGESLDRCVERFLEPFRAHAPQVLRAFKTIALGDRLALSREQREQCERETMVATWVHPDHCQASDRFLSEGNRERMNGEARKLRRGTLVPERRVPTLGTDADRQGS